MMQMNKYKINPNITKEKLIDYGFLKVREGYLYKIPAYKYKKKYTLLYLNFLVTFEENIPQLIIDCKDNNGKWYIPFYNSSYCKNNIVLKNVTKRLRIVIDDMAKNKIIQTKINYTNVKEKK